MPPVSSCWLLLGGKGRHTVTRAMNDMMHASHGRDVLIIFDRLCDRTPTCPGLTQPHADDHGQNVGVLYIAKTFSMLPTDRMDYSPAFNQGDERFSTGNPFTWTADPWGNSQTLVSHLNVLARGQETSEFVLLAKWGDKAYSNWPITLPGG